MCSQINRRDFLKVVGVTGISATLFSVDSLATDLPMQNFSFAQLSDTHWGFDNPAINPDFAGTLKKAIAGLNALEQQPDFVVFTGDLTHTTDDETIRRKRMKEFREITKELKVQNLYFLPGEHDASLDNGKAFKEFFLETHYVFDHKGVHFIALDNVSDPHATLGEEQLIWLKADLEKLDKNTRIVVLTHRPLFDLAADWDWNTADGAKAIELLTPFSSVAVLYGHIHQVNNHMTGQIVHHSAMGLMYPLPAPHSVPKKIQLPWDAANPYKGLGYRQVQAKTSPVDFAITDMPVVSAGAEQVIKITAKKFEYSPDKITLKKGVPVTLSLVSLDQLHGFNCPGLNIRSDIAPEKVSTIRFTPEKSGTFDFHCDVFCGSGHDQMTGTITVTE
ncbi:MAG: cupredoxin domain-containing protein [Sedimentisphaerales bacterium]|jgi:Icc-related predicted phosphoesterase/plastocyanin